MKFISLSKTGEFPDIPKNILKEEFSLPYRASEPRMRENQMLNRNIIKVKNKKIPIFKKRSRNETLSYKQLTKPTILR